MAERPRELLRGPAAVAGVANTATSRSHDDERCPGCEAPRPATRCDRCGAATSPGGYRVIRLLAQGPHGRVYLATAPGGERVALKELVFSLVPGVKQLEAFEREAAILRQLAHPAIPRCLASFQEGEGIHVRLYLAQEFVEGESLEQRLAGHRFTEAEVVALARQLLDTLVYLQDLSPVVIHRDLKPSNVILRADGTLALVDFGAARELLRDVTHGATLVGTFGYMPPEALGGTVDGTSDLYALGATLVQLLTRRSPSELLKPGMQLDFGEALNASPGLRTFLAKLVEPRPEARYPSAREARSALEALLAAKLPLPTRQGPAPGQRGRLVAVGAAVGFAVAALVALVATTLVARAPVVQQAQPALLPRTGQLPAEAPQQLTKPSQSTAAHDGVIKRHVVIHPHLPAGLSAAVPATCDGGCAFETDEIHLEHKAGARTRVWLNYRFVAPRNAGCASAFVQLRLVGDRQVHDLRIVDFPAQAGSSSVSTVEFEVPDDFLRGRLVFGPQERPDAAFLLDFLAKDLAQAP